MRQLRDEEITPNYALRFGIGFIGAQSQTYHTASAAITAKKREAKREAEAPRCFRKACAYRHVQFIVADRGVPVQEEIHRDAGSPGGAKLFPPVLGPATASGSSYKTKRPLRSLATKEFREAGRRDVLKTKPTARN